VRLEELSIYGHRYCDFPRKILLCGVSLYEDLTFNIFNIYEDYHLLWGMSAEPQELRSHNVKILNFRMDINIFCYLAMCINF